MSFEYITTEHDRLLKGGGGGGGGAGGGGASSGGLFVLWLGSDGDGPSKGFWWGFGLGLVALNIILVFLVLNYIRFRARKRKDKFRDAVTQAQAHVQKNILQYHDGKNEITASTAWRPVNGWYLAEYYERGHGNVKSFVNLRFVGSTETAKNVDGDTGYLSNTSNNCWTILGEGKDADGDFEVTQGRLAPNGEAFWIEKQGKRHILVRGSFSREHDKLYGGEWTADNGISGRFTRFVLVQRTSTFPEEGAADLETGSPSDNQTALETDPSEICDTYSEK